MDPVLLVAEVRSGQKSRISGPNILSYGTWQRDLISAIDAYKKRPRRSLVANEMLVSKACKERSRTTG
ncbi:hypothetical protein BMJ26_18150 [Sinorhizobium medicae]|nr:hypothetical protein BMJ31_23285 [Sinorhizobium medicae]PLU26437.1 hypothetical protein BMJ28_31960 [Sinorhizobium medicae]PLU36970.1 hypothetical protein BMJ26_18150 [Sinorhizobium medicae]PLU49808.1 hypothetical protein BMJ24_29945 [Sinorhizobium medicae]PLU67819.1 hypothetical protein BMJ20_21765 [Sinorhizobium medicae]